MRILRFPITLGVRTYQSVHTVKEVDHDFLNEIDLGPEGALSRAVDPGMGGGGGQQLQCGKCIKEQCVSPENCAAGDRRQ